MKSFIHNVRTLVKKFNSNQMYAFKCASHFGIKNVTDEIGIQIYLDKTK